MQRALYSSVGLLCLLKPAHAYSNTLAACAEFAALWNGSCGGTDENAVYNSSTFWNFSGAGATTSNCSIATDGKQARVPDGGSLADSYSVFARNCITCKEDTNGEIKLRVQTNNMPKHCYGSSDASSVTSYPATKRIDFEMNWNSDVLGV